MIDHAKPMKEQIERLKLPPVALIASLTNTEQHYKALADIIAPQGKFGLIDDPAGIQRQRLQGQGGLDPLGVDVHALARSRRLT